MYKLMSIMQLLLKSVNSLILSGYTLIIISHIINNVICSPSRQPTPTPINQPTAFPTPVPFALCCDCTTSTNTPGCPIDPECEQQICIDLGDPICCDFAWDQQCANNADLICNPPTPPPTQAPTTTFPLCCACTIPTVTPGCPQDQTCEDLICGTDNYCCTIAWDALCVPFAQDICILGSPHPTNAPTTSPTTNPTPEPSPNPTDFPTIDPTISPTIYPTSEPTSQPTFTPTSSPSTSPTLNPTLNPTKSPTIYPTSEPTPQPTFKPTQIPTSQPTDMPTINPTQSPTHSPSISPTRIPTSQPTNQPTFMPTKSPSTSPTLNPTESPSIEPTKIPTRIPTIDPTNYPTMVPTTDAPTSNDSTVMPTMNPTINPTIWPTVCPECYKYWVKLVDIEQEDDKMETEDCDMVHNKHKHKNKNNKRKRGKHRRRMLHNDKENKYWYNNEANEEHNNYDKCTVNGWGQKRRRFIENNKHYDCKSRDLSEKRSKHRSHHWSSSSSSSSDEDSNNDNILTEICLTYTVNKYEYNCGKLYSLFLPLCNNNQTDYNSSDITAEDLDGIITKIHPNSLDASGVKLYGKLGIQIDFNECVDKFKLCLKNISIDENYYKNNFDKITISNWVIFKMHNIYEGCTNNDGLPCFNFIFDKKCPKKCECNDGMTQITTKYIGDIKAKMIVFYHFDDELCVFLNVMSNEEITCSVQFSIYDKLLPDTEFVVFYENNSECKGTVDTSCSIDNMNIINGECAVDKLKVIGYKDIDGNICDESVFNHKNDKYKIIPKNNVLLENKFNEVSNAADTSQINSNWKMEYIILILAVISCVAMIFYYVRYYRQSSDDDCPNIKIEH